MHAPLTPSRLPETCRTQAYRARAHTLITNS